MKAAAVIGRSGFGPTRRCSTSRARRYGLGGCEPPAPRGLGGRTGSPEPLVPHVVRRLRRAAQLALAPPSSDAGSPFPTPGTPSPVFRRAESTAAPGLLRRRLFKADAERGPGALYRRIATRPFGRTGRARSPCSSLALPSHPRHPLDRWRRRLRLQPSLGYSTCRARASRRPPVRWKRCGSPIVCNDRPTV